MATFREQLCPKCGEHVPLIQPFGRLVDSGHCPHGDFDQTNPPIAQCFVCLGLDGDATEVARLRAESATLYEPPPGWVCPFGATARDYETAMVRARAETNTAMAEQWDVGYGPILDGKTDVQQVDILNGLITRKAMLPEVAERIAELRGVALDAESPR